MRRRFLTTAVSVLALLASAGCKRSSGAPTPTPAETSSKQPAEEGTTAYEGTTAGSSSAAAAGTETKAEAPTPNPSPLQLTEDRLKKWVAYHGELITFLTAERKQLTAAAGKGDAKALEEVAKISKDTDAGTVALRKKYAFEPQEDEDIGHAINDVLAAMSMENETMAPTVAELKQQAATPGDAGESARLALKTMQDDEKTSLETARLQYGPKAVDLIAAHRAELAKQQQAALAAAFGG